MKTEKIEEDEIERLKRRVRLSMLYDFYGALLKEKQRNIFEAYILDDYGLSEIARFEDTSRQAVYETIKRVNKQLDEYEKKLGLVERFEKQKDAIRQIIAQMENLEADANSEKLKKITELLKALSEDE